MELDPPATAALSAPAMASHALMQQQGRGPSQVHPFKGDAGGICDDIENAVGDILCDALDELERVLLNEDSVLLDAEEIRPCV
eukprot:SAG31_NODE_19589_length_597_cov_1.915663_1_plen_82_part_01